MSETGGDLPYRLRSTPRPEVHRLLNKLPSGSSVLDVGAGVGNNAALLLKNGHRVVALEPHEAGLNALRQLQTGYLGSLSILSTTIESMTLQENFDAVICSMVLHFIDQPGAERCLQQLRAHTKPGGFHAISWYLADQNLSAGTYRTLLQPNELKRRYDDWTCLHYREQTQINLTAVRRPKELAAWIRGNRGYRHAQVLARKPIV
jgi:2-polyprenyl-3-methyl-5-hydroxy-6-metoxy-1,4-benzoquinol methylase